MSDLKITELTALTAPVDADLLVIVDDPSGLPATKKITRANLLTNVTDPTSDQDVATKAYVDSNSLIDEGGWQDIDALTRDSDTTATIASDWSDRIKKGDKIKWLSDTTQRYNVVRQVSESGGATTITTFPIYVTTANDSRFESGEAITEPKISKAENPHGFPGWFSWTPTIGGFSSDPTGLYKLKVSANEVKMFITQTAAGTSNANTFTISLPVTASNVATNFLFGVGLRAYRNNSANVAGGGAIITNLGTTIALQPTSLSSSGWTTSNEKQIFELQMSYLF